MSTRARRQGMGMPARRRDSTTSTIFNAAMERQSQICRRKMAGLSLRAHFRQRKHLLKGASVDQARKAGKRGRTFSLTGRKSTA